MGRSTQTTDLIDEMTDHRSRTEPDQTTQAKLLDLSLAQIVGGALAAATAAALGSRLGVAGTITGAALGSVTTAVVAALYAGSVSRARRVIVVTRRGQTEAPAVGAVETRPHRRLLARRSFVTAGAVFALAAAFLTGFQLSTGAPVTGTSIGVRTETGAGPRAARATQRPAADAPATTPTTAPAPAEATTASGSAAGFGTSTGQPTGIPTQTATVPASGTTGTATVPASPTPPVSTPPTSTP